MYRCLVAVLAGAFAPGAIGCSVSPPPIPIHEEAGLIIELAHDPYSGDGHNHPASLSVAQITAALRGLQLRGRDVAGTFGLLGDDHNNPALLDRDIARIAPQLAAGLSKASPKDLVTFHLTQRDSNRAPLITSGGVFVRNRHFWIILANARTSPSTVQYETTYEPNSRLNPLLPITRFKFVVNFMPPDQRVPTLDARKLDRWDGYRYLDESKVVVLDLGRLPQ